MTVTMITAGILALLLLFLAGYVIAGRVKFKIDLGDGGNEAMRQRIRAQANFVEYVPVALILMMLVETGSIGPRWLIIALGATLVIARLWHAQGILSKPGVSAGRFMGTNLTGLVLLAGSLDYSVAAAVAVQEPAFVAKYAFELSQAFNLFYHRHRILSEEDPAKKMFLLRLSRLVERQLVTALDLLGIIAPEKM